MKMNLFTKLNFTKRATYILLLVLLSSVPVYGQPETTDGWETATPAVVGINQTLLDDLHQKIASGDLGHVDSMLIIRHGKMVYEKHYERDYVAINKGQNPAVDIYNYYSPKYHPFYQDTRLHSMQSTTKSVQSAIFGVAMQNGFAFDLDKSILSYFEDYEIANVDARKKNITLRHMLNMRAGFDWDESSTAYNDAENAFLLMTLSDDWVKYVLDLPMAYEPGEEFFYNSGVSLVLSAIFQKITGTDVASYGGEHLFQPMGITDFYWKKTPQGVSDGQEGLYITSSDLAKLGQLMLNGGLWNQKQLVSPDWMSKMTQPHAEGGEVSKPGYGFQWWFSPLGNDSSSMLMAGRGYGGQLLLIDREHDTVVVFTGWNIYGEGLSRSVYQESILPALEN